MTGSEGRRPGLRDRITAGAVLGDPVAAIEEGVVDAVDELRGRPVSRPSLLYAALGAVLASLLAMILVPVLLQHDLDAVHDELDQAVDPAAQHVEELRYFIAREMALARGFALSGDSAMLEGLHAMRDSATQRADSFPEQALALSPDIASDVGAAAAYVQAWHREFDPSRIGMEPSSSPDAFSRREYEVALGGLDSLRASLAVSTTDRRALVRDAERQQIIATVALGTLALVAAVLVVWLVSRVRRLSRIAELQREETERATRARDRLIRGMSHDLKNPLSIIDGYAELLEMGLRGPLTAEQQQTIGRIRSAVRSLLSTVVELVDLASAQAGLLRVARELIPVGPLIGELAADYAPVAEASDIELTLAKPGELPSFQGDRRRVRQIMENLVGNAIKYTPAGGSIELSAERAEQFHGRGGGWIGLHVNDTGPGIPADQIESVFDEFVRLDNAAGTSGSGVGLAMARGLARAMGGEIAVVSRPQVGSIFTLWMPLGTTDRRPARRRV